MDAHPPRGDLPPPAPGRGYLDPEHLRRRFGAATFAAPGGTGPGPARFAYRPASAADSGSCTATDGSEDEDEGEDEDEDGGGGSDGELDRRAQLEWDENVRQLQLLVDVVLLPFVGKWLGRKTAYWAYGRYTDLGFRKAFFGGLFAGEAAAEAAAIVAHTSAA